MSDINVCRLMVKSSNEIIFIIQTNEEDCYWYWIVDKADVEKYFNTNINNVSADMVTKFCNDPENSYLGTSSSGYDHMEEIFDELKIAIITAEDR